MKLYGFRGGLFPPRVDIYLAEKGIKGIERIVFDMGSPWPPPEMERMGPLGTVPILETEDGTLIRASVAILEYLEERFPAPTMLGATPEVRAQTRVLMSVIEEATLQLGVWCHKASPLFAGREPQHPVAAAFARDDYFARLRKLDLLAAEAAGPFLTGPQVTIADCAAMATLQFADRFYGVPVPRDCPHLVAWYGMFSARPSARPPAYPAAMLEKAYGLDAAADAGNAPTTT
jgi:glutathione S-transferase